MSSRITPGNVPATQESPAAEPATEHDRAIARSRLERKRKFAGDVVAYLAFNAFLIVIWAVSGRGNFWPGWVLGGWGVLLVLDAWSLYFRRPITADDVEREMRRGR